VAQTYDPKKVSVIVDGVIVTGYMDGSFVKCAKNADNVLPHIGADGGVTYTENADNTGTITLTIKQNSLFYAKAVELATQKREFATRVIDSNDTGSMKAGGTQCRIVKTPDIERSAEITGIEINIYVADYSAA
jgi:hypothetical protein